MAFLEELIKFLGGSIVVVGAAAWLAKSLVKGLLEKDLKAFEHKAEEELERLKGTMARKANSELETLRDRLQRDRESEGRSAQATAARNERIRGEVLKWANPILGAVADLRSRLVNILHDDADVALHASRRLPAKPGWSIQYAYFMPSTLYLFCTYFHWVRRLHEELSFELFETQHDKDAFLAQLRKVSDALGGWPMDPPCSGDDAQVFNLQQRVLGEALTVRSDGSRCMGYDEFLENWEDAPLSIHLAPLRELLQEPNRSDCRWRRLQDTLAALASVEAHCRQILQAVPIAAAPGPAMP